MISPPPTIRPAEVRDLETIVDFNVRLAAETEHLRLDRDTLRRGVTQLLERPELGRYFIAQLESALIGQAMITFEWSDWRSGMFWWLQSVYVDAAFRRQGVFRALFEHIAAEARRAPGVCGLRLYVERENLAALATYAQLGMRASGHLVYELDWSSAVGPSSD